MAKLLRNLRNHSGAFSDRNTTWAGWIDDRLDKPGTVFVAVGAGHLAGKDSVQDVLAKRKIEAKRVDSAAR